MSIMGADRIKLTDCLTAEATEALSCLAPYFLRLNRRLAGSKAPSYTPIHWQHLHTPSAKIEWVEFPGREQAGSVPSKYSGAAARASGLAIIAELAFGHAPHAVVM
jgi:hypothetical protein